MEHILTQCATRANRIIWTLAKEAWPHHHNPWPLISIGLILGIGCLNAPQDENPQDQHRMNPRTQVVNGRGFYTLKGLAEEYVRVRVRVRVQLLKPSLNPYPSEGLRVYPWPNPCSFNKLKIIQIGPKMKKICSKQCLNHIFFTSG